MKRNVSHGFTLIELLVVITIIVVLLALLVPAMEKAIYQAELTVCAARLKGIGATAQTYAIANARTYPDRTRLRDTTWRWPNQIADTDSGYDLRPMLMGYAPLDILLCPFAKKVSYQPADTSDVSGPLPWVGFSPYALWFGFKYDNWSGMKRLGDRLSWSADAGRNFDYFRVLAADWEMLLTGSSWGAHPDHDGIMSPFFTQNGLATQRERHTITRWQNTTTLRKTADRNFAFDDGSVRLIMRIEPQDPRLTPVGLATNSTDANLPSGREQLPSIGQ